MEIREVPAGSADALALIGELDADILARYPGAPIHGIDVPSFEAAGGRFFVAHLDGVAVGCAALRPLIMGAEVPTPCVEVKRVYVREGFRRRGVGRGLMAHVEGVARRAGFTHLILETGDRQPEAVALYSATGWHEIPLYGEYVGYLHSLCFGKTLP